MDASRTGLQAVLACIAGRPETDKILKRSGCQAQHGRVIFLTELHQGLFGRRRRCPPPASLRSPSSSKSSCRWRGTCQWLHRSTR